MDMACPVAFATADLPDSTCPNCGFVAWSQSAHLSSDEFKRLDDRIVHRRRIKRNEYVNRAGSAFTSLQVINSGFLMTSIMGGGGNAQVTGFSMRGEMVGLEALGSGEHQCDTIALEDSSLCAIAFPDFERLAGDISALQSRFHRAMSTEIARDRGIMFLLGSMRAEERVAQFLLSLSRRFAARGCSETHFRLPMSRSEIGNFLGVKLETVSRSLSRLGDLDLIAIDGKDIELKSVERLHQMTGRADARTSLESPRFSTC